MRRRRPAARGPAIEQVRSLSPLQRPFLPLLILAVGALAARHDCLPQFRSPFTAPTSRSRPW